MIQTWFKLDSNLIQKWFKKGFRRYSKSHSKMSIIALSIWKVFQTCFVLQKWNSNFFHFKLFLKSLLELGRLLILYGHFIPRYWKENPLFVLTKQIFLSPVFFLFFGRQKQGFRSNLLRKKYKNVKVKKIFLILWILTPKYFLNQTFWHCWSYLNMIYFFEGWIGYEIFM